MTNFPDYLKKMMQKGNRMLAHEYEVSDSILLLNLFQIFI